MSHTAQPSEPSENLVVRPEHYAVLEEARRWGQLVLCDTNDGVFADGVEDPRALQRLLDLAAERGFAAAGMAQTLASLEFRAKDGMREVLHSLGPEADLDDVFILLRDAFEQSGYYVRLVTAPPGEQETISLLALTVARLH